VERYLVGTGVLGELKQVLVLPEDILDLRCEERGGADAGAELFDVRDRLKSEALDDDLRKLF
jgi:hypothetical protein